MFWWSAAAERRQILIRFSAERTLLIDMCADIFRYAATDIDPVVRKALQVIERRQRDRSAIGRSPHESLEAAIQLAQRAARHDAETLADISALSGIKATTGEADLPGHWRRRPRRSLQGDRSQASVPARPVDATAPSRTDDADFDTRV